MTMEGHVLQVPPLLKVDKEGGDAESGSITTL